MGVNKDEELLFTECKESVDDVFGWKVVIFMPQNTFWKVFIMITVSISFVITTIKVFYLHTNKIFYILEVLCDGIYFLDVLFATLHFGLGKTRKLRHGERRPFIFLLVDIFSLIPLNLLFEYLIYEETENFLDLPYILRANILLRTYQVPKGFIDIKKTVSRIKTYYLLIFIEIFTYSSLLTHLFGCLMQKYFDKTLREKCLSGFALCVIENDLLSFALLGHNYIAPLSLYPLDDYKSLLVVEYLFGFLLSYGYITPIIIYINLAFLKEFFEYSYKRKQLSLLIKNTIEDKVLKRKLTNYFHYAWTYGTGGNLPEIINLFPLSFQKTVFYDIHWEALRHSELLQDLSDGCKRSVCLYMTTDFILPKTVLFQKEKMKTSFVYLESGLVQVMAEENNESPLLNLSDGTVLGEISFFYQTESKVLLRTGKFSVVHVLKCTDLFRVLLHYPKDMKKIWHKVKLRMKIARAVHKNKAEIYPLFLNDPNFKLTTLPTVKWLKQQFRALIKLEKGGELKKEDLSLDRDIKTSGTHNQHIYYLETQLEHTSLYLSLLNINDEGEKAYNFVCLKESLPWLLDPDSHFLTVWKFINSAAIVVVMVLYPAILGWFSCTPAWFMNVAILINLIYVLDIFLQLITAVKVKGVISTKFSTMLSQRFSNLGFYLDLVAALPLYLIVYFYGSCETSLKLNLLFGNAFLKLYKIIPMVNKICYNPAPGIYYRATVKYILIMYFSIYWAAAMYNTMNLKCSFYDFYDKNKRLNSSISVKNNDIFVSLFVALYVVLDIPNKSIHTDDTWSFVVYYIGYIISNYLVYAWQGECIACYILEHSNEIEYRQLMEHVDDFMVRNKVERGIKKRVMETLDFQWLYDNGNYITQKRRILEDLSKDLREEVDRSFLFPTLKKSQLFMWESDEFFMDLCGRARRLAVPPNSLLMTFGTQAMALYLIHKGYVQVNSFVVGDAHLDISTPLIFMNGHSFPVVVAFSQIPAAITAISLTDCELLILDLEDILTTVMTYRVFPDMVQALMQIDLTPMSSARLGLSKIKRKLELDEESFNAPFLRLKKFGSFLKFFFIKKGINARSQMYLCWETVRNVLIFFNLIMWPLVFGCGCRWDARVAMIYVLLVLDVVSSLVDFYFRLHIGYYNDLGIYVMHPLTTFRHYLTSSFLLDLIAFTPNFHMMHLLRTKQLNFELSTVTVHLVMRSLSAYRIIGFFNYSTYNLKRYLNIIKFIKLTLFGLFILHYYINFMAYFFLQGKGKSEIKFSSKYNFEPNHPYQYYFYELSLTVSILWHGEFYFESHNIYNFVWISILGTLRMFIQTFIFSVLTLNITISTKNFTVYQYYFRSFTKYLNDEKVDDIASNQAIKYFEYKWHQCKGIEMQNIFSTFPYTLHEDVVFPLYRDTLRGVRCLSRANESFYRTLSRNVQAVTVKSTSTIIFRDQVQAEIFFVHRGKCFVEQNSKILIKGSVIGDIKNGQLMKHTIKTLTNVSLLTIPSKLFFLIISNFYDTKRAFQLEAAAADDFLESTYVDRGENIVIEIEALTKEQEPLEAEFKIASHGPESLGTKPFEVKKRRTIWNPNSLFMRMLNFIFFMDAYITVIVVPIFIGVTLMTWWALTIIYCLDAVWIIKIILTSRPGFRHSKTQSRTQKAVVLNYLRKFDGILLHVLSVLPIELIAVAYYRERIFSEYCHVMYFCYSNRLLRFPHLHYYIKSKINELLMNVYLKLLNILIFGLALFNFFVCLNLLVRRNKHFKKGTCEWGIKWSQIQDLGHGYFYVLNHFVASGVSTEPPESALEIVFQLSVELWSLLSKALVVTQMLVIIYVKQFTKLDQLLKLQHLEKYLSIRDVSPALMLKMQKYSCNLLNAYKEEAYPSFLRNVPPFIKINIMEGLYLHHLSECYIFQGIPEIFLKQLVLRLDRFIFFPGDHIVHIGDVDQNMYFIHKGEVKCVEVDQRYPALERTVDLLVAGESFGIMQGISFSLPHMNTYRAKVLSDILVLNYQKWEDMRLAFPQIMNKIYKKLQQTGPAKVQKMKQS